MTNFDSLSNEEWILARRLVQGYRDGKILRIFGISLAPGGNRLTVHNGKLDLRPQDYDLLRKLEDRDLVEIQAVVNIDNTWLIRLKDSLLAVSQDRISPRGIPSTFDNQTDNGRPCVRTRGFFYAVRQVRKCMAAMAEQGELVRFGERQGYGLSS